LLVAEPYFAHDGAHPAAEELVALAQETEEFPDLDAERHDIGGGEEEEEPAEERIERQDDHDAAHRDRCAAAQLAIEEGGEDIERDRQEDTEHDQRGGDPADIRREAPPARAVEIAAKHTPLGRREASGGVGGDQVRRGEGWRGGNEFHLGPPFPGGQVRARRSG